MGLHESAAVLLGGGQGGEYLENLSGDGGKIEPHARLIFKGEVKEKNLVNHHIHTLPSYTKEGNLIASSVNK